MATCGVVSPTGAHNNLSPPSSRAQSILWRAQHKPPTLSFMPLLRGRGLWGMRGCTGERVCVGGGRGPFTQAAHSALSFEEAASSSAVCVCVCFVRARVWAGGAGGGEEWNICCMHTIAAHDEPRGKGEAEEQVQRCTADCVGPLCHSTKATSESERNGQCGRDIPSSMSSASPALSPRSFDIMWASIVARGDVRGAAVEGRVPKYKTA